MTVAWISDFPIEWMPDAPESIRCLPRSHPLTWQRVLLAEFEKRADLKLHIVVLRKGIKANVFFQRNGVSFHVVRVPRVVRAAALFWVDTLLIRPVLKTIQPDLVHAWGTERGGALIASRLPYPYLVTVQGLLTWYEEMIPLNYYERFAAVLERFSFRRARVLTTESTFAARYIAERFPHLTVFQAEHAPNWLFHQVKRHPKTDPIRFLCVATLGYRKGTDLLLEGLDQLVKELPFEVVVTGNPKDPYFQPFQRRLSPELWRRIEFKTNLSPAQVAAEMSLATILLFPTRADTSPNAVKEAVVAGLPVVASSVGGIPDYVFPGQNGFLFKSGDLPGCVSALRNACSHPLFSRGRVEAATLEQTRHYLSPARMGQRFFEVYQRLMDPKRASSLDRANACPTLS